MHEFMGAFDAANAVALLPIYAASETPIEGIDSTYLQEGMLARGHRRVSVLADLDDGQACAQTALDAGDIVIMMGAGSIGTLANQLRERATV